jgi:hypothetical protein
MSQRKKIKKKNVNFYKPNVIFTPPEMNFIFKSMLDNCGYFKIHRQVIKETMLEAIESKDEEALASGAILQTLGVESIVKQEIYDLVSYQQIIYCSNINQKHNNRASRLAMGG